MTGGFSSTAASEYISEHGLVQVSKEENTGILQVFSEGHVQKNAFLKIKPKSCPEITGSSVIEGEDIVSEYYPQKTTATYLFHGSANDICEYSGDISEVKSMKDIASQVSVVIKETSLQKASPGIYARATKLAGQNLNFIKFDLDIDRKSLNSLATMNNIINNEMALIHVLEENGKAVITDAVKVNLGEPIHVRIENEAYLIFPYRYNGHN